MGVLSRWKHLSTPRAAGSGRIWDNNYGVGAGQEYQTVTPFTTTAQTENYTPGPNPAPGLATGAYARLDRQFMPYLKLQPQVPVKDPWATSSVYVQQNKQSTAQPRNQVAPAIPQGQYRAMSPSQTMQRDLEYDAADSDKALQRGHFITPSQRYFNERTPLPEFTTPSVPSHSVIAGNNEYYPVESKRGWYQGFDPGIAMRENDMAVSPPWLLSTPLNVKTIIYSEYDTHRKPIVAKAPKRRKQASGV